MLDGALLDMQWLWEPYVPLHPGWYQSFLPFAAGFSAVPALEVEEERKGKCLTWLKEQGLPIVSLEFPTCAPLFL